MAEIENSSRTFDQRNWWTASGIAVVSLIYFADVFLRASRKLFWFDELFTVYLCRLPNFRSTWTAVAHGADFNPPLFYLLTRGAQHLFGEGLIATRLPEMLGVWLFGICIFLFVSKRAGHIAGFIAGTLPFFTLAQFYAYEARPHGITLGWCGLALLCWQKAEDGTAKYRWLCGMGLSLAAAMLTHVYAVYLIFPFALVELFGSFRTRRINWGMAVALAAPLTLAVAVFLPMFRVYRSTMPVGFAAATRMALPLFFVNTMGPATAVFLLFVLLLVFGAQPRLSEDIRNRRSRELLLLLGFCCLPLVGWLGSRFSHGPFIDRYFLSSIAGFSIFFGYANSPVKVQPWVSKWLAGAMLLLMLGDLAGVITARLKNNTTLEEASVGVTLSTNPRDPLDLYPALSSLDKPLDVLVLPDLSYFYFFNYAPPAVVSHLYFGAEPGDLLLGGYERLARWAHVGLRTTTFENFMSTHRRFLVYANVKGNGSVQRFLSAGYKLKSASAGGDGILYEYEK